MLPPLCMYYGYVSPLLNLYRRTAWNNFVWKNRGRRRRRWWCISFLSIEEPSRGIFFVAKASSIPPKSVSSSTLWHFFSIWPIHVIICYENDSKIRRKKIFSTQGRFFALSSLVFFGPKPLKAPNERRLFLQKSLECPFSVLSSFPQPSRSLAPFDPS